MRDPRGLLLAACALPLAVCAATAQQLVLEPCERRGIEPPVRCGTLTVPEDPDGRRTIQLNIVIVGATGPERNADPLFYLAGGPGQAATDLAPSYGRALAAVRRTRDLVFVDQRGTGTSSPLRCAIADPESQLRAMIAFEFPAERLAGCRRSYAAAIEWYGTTQAAHDLERARRALNAERVNLLGASYGTRVALTYMRLHPDRVRSAVLAGVTQPGSSLGESFAVDADSALAGLARECTAQPACAAIAPDLASIVRATAARLEATPERAHWTRATDTIPVTVDRTLFVAGTRFLLYAGAFTTNLPRVVRAAHDGDFRPFLSAIGTFADLLNDQLAAGLFLTVICAEDIAAIDSARHARATAPTVLRTVGVRGLMDACRDWPRAPLPPGFLDPIRVPVPTLMFSGATDPITPPWHAAKQALLLPNSAHVVTPHASHVDLQVCELGIIARFVEAGSVRDLDVACAASRPPRAFGGLPDPRRLRPRAPSL